MPHIAGADVELSYSRVGSGEPVLFIQGTGIEGRVWAPQVSELSSEFDCISFDNRGIGGSTGDISALTVDVMVRDTVTLLDALGLERVHVVGHSLGGVVAQQLALDHTERVRTLTLMCTLHRGKDAFTPTWALVKNGLLTTIGSARSKRRAFTRMIMPHHYVAERGVDVLADELSELFGRDIGEPPMGIVRAQLGALAKHDSAIRLPELRELPTFVLCGDEDPIGRPVLARRLAEAVATPHLVELENASHGLTIQHARRTNELLRQHLARATL